MERAAEEGAMAPGEEEIGTGITPVVAGTTMVGNVDRTGVITVEEEMTEEEAVAGEVATLTSGIETVAEEWAARTETTNDTRR